LVSVPLLVFYHQQNCINQLINALSYILIGINWYFRFISKLLYLIMTSKVQFIGFLAFIVFNFIFIGNSLSQQVIINEDPAISKLMENYKQWNNEEKTVQGWRIQIINTDDRRKMESTLAKFRFHFPEVNYVSWIQVSPYYKVKVGAYDSKLTVLAFLQNVKEYFPSAIPVIEKIKKTELLGL